MARPINTTVITTRGARIRNIYEDGTDQVTEVWPGNKVTDLAYVDGVEAKTISGVVKRVIQYFDRVTNKLQTSTREGYTALDGHVVALVIDASDTNSCNVVIVPAKDIVEYAPAVSTAAPEEEAGAAPTKSEVERVEIDPIIKVQVVISLSDGSEEKTDIVEGQDLFELRVMKHGKAVKGDYHVASFLRKINQKHDDIEVVGMILINDKGHEEHVLFTSLRSAGKEGEVITSQETAKSTLQEVLKDPKKAGVTIGPMTLDQEEIKFTSSTHVNGAQANVTASKGARATDVIGTNETVVKKKVSLNVDGSHDGKSVIEGTLNGLTLTDEATIDMNHASAVDIKNTKMVGMKADNAKSMLIFDSKTFENKNPLKLNVEGCYFGNNTQQESEAV